MAEKRKETGHFKISVISYVKLNLIVCIRVLLKLYLDENFVIYT